MNLYNTAKKYVPISVKRSLGKYLMSLAPRFSGDTVQVKDGRRFKVIQDRLFLGVFMKKEYEADLSAIASQLIREGDVVADVGANFGWYTTLFAKTVGLAGSVHSFEPFPRTFDILHENVKLNDMHEIVSLNNVCVGQEVGEVSMACDGASDSGLAHVTTNTTSNSVTVKSVRIDDVLKNDCGSIAYLKIDIEGFEHHALMGMPNILQSSNPPIIQIEVNDEALERASSSRSELISLLAGYEYRFFSPDRSKGGWLIECDGANDSDIFCMPLGDHATRFQDLIIN